MNTWIPSATLDPAIELLVRRWHLPAERSADVARLLEIQREGGTACELGASAPTDVGAWGDAAHDGEAGEVSSPRPLVLRRHNGRVYLQAWRFFQAEEAIAGRLLARAGQAAPRLTRPAAELLADLGSAEVNARQAQAITGALEHTLALITGGPGTGKTHTIARLLALLIAADPERGPVVHLVAPTGKAADRMKAAVEAAADQLPAAFSEQTRRALKRAAGGASTLHRLLGFNPSTGRCRHGSREPLRSDVVIVDECSMVDTLLWQALLAALPAATRLVLVGDPHQLESVAAGDVLGSLVRCAQRGAAGGLGQVWTELTESHRFRHRPGIGGLAAAVVNFQADDAMALLASHPPPADGSAPADGLAWLGDHGGHFAWAHLPAVVQTALTAVADARTASEALAALPRVRLLTAHREHALGVTGLNEAIHRHFLARAGARRTPNQPIIIDRNDPETGLTNGSVGIVLEVDGGRAAYFPATSAAGDPRRIALGQLPDHRAAWALTIHRSQGSEFDQVVVILPAEESPLASRELLYTAITRAREGVHVWGGEATVRAALGVRAQRCTLLEASLARPAGAPRAALRGQIEI